MAYTERLIDKFYYKGKHDGGFAVNLLTVAVAGLCVTGTLLVVALSGMSARQHVAVVPPVPAIILERDSTTITMLVNECPNGSQLAQYTIALPNEDLRAKHHAAAKALYTCMYSAGDRSVRDWADYFYLKTLWYSLDGPAQQASVGRQIIVMADGLNRDTTLKDLKYAAFDLRTMVTKALEPQ
jgi:hypothetical protein